MKTTDYIEYHFKIEPKMKRKLKILAEKEKMSLSHIINHLFEKSFQLLEYFDFQSQIKRECKSQERKTEKVTENIWCHIKKIYKNKLFALQHHYQLQSKAKILRFLLRKYLKKLERQGKEWTEKFIKRFQIKWEKIKAQNKIPYKHITHKPKPAFYLAEFYTKNYELYQISFS